MFSLQVYHESECRLRGLTQCQEELTKFEEELKKYDDWMTDNEAKLRGKQKKGTDMESLKDIIEEHRVSTQQWTLRNKGLVLRGGNIKEQKVGTQQGTSRNTCLVLRAWTLRNTGLVLRGT